MLSALLARPYAHIAHPRTSVAQRAGERAGGVMADFPALPLWTDAYLADTTHLSHAEHGRYLLMLIHIWRIPDKRFPNDDGWLSRKFGCSENEVRELFRPLISEFFKSNGNYVYHKRIRREFVRLQIASSRQSARAKVRWDKQNDACSAGIAEPAKQPEPYHLKKESKLPLGVVSHVGGPNGANGDSPPESSDSNSQALAKEEKADIERTAPANGGGDPLRDPDDEPAIQSEWQQAFQRFGLKTPPRKPSWVRNPDGTFSRTKP